MLNYLLNPDVINKIDLKIKQVRKSIINAN